MADPGGVPVSVDTLRALAHRTRFLVLRALLERPKTVSELGRELESSKGTVHRHLEQLAEAGFVERREDERQWVYHELTPAGEALASADRPRVVIELAGALLLGSLGLAAAAARARLAGRFGPDERTSASQAPGAGDPAAGGDGAGLLAEPTTWLAAGLVLLAVAVLLVLLARRQLRRPTR